MPEPESSMNSYRNVVGLMSGTSADGIDAVVVAIAGSGNKMSAQLRAHLQVPFGKALRERILNACLHGTVADLCELNFILGEHFAKAAIEVIRAAKLKPKDIFAIGSHGQTVHHLPRAKTPATLQIGEPSIIAERTGILTVADFRVRDMAAGGEGAPLVTYVDWAMQSHATRPRILQNIGGIGNLTFLAAGAKLNEVMAFDTGPGNMVMDAVISGLSLGRLKYDRGGQLAAKGKVCEPLLKTLLKHPFFKMKPPKTTGREEFGEPFVAKLLEAAHRLKLSEADTMRTATAFTVESIAQAYERFVKPQIKLRDHAKTEVIVGGGGAMNRTLLQMLGERVAPFAVMTQADVGGSIAGKEALAFAVLAYETLNGQPSNVPSATGAKRAVLLGKIIPV